MGRHRIPKNAGPFYIITTKAGTPAVWNKKIGKGKVLIACKNMNQAKEALKKKPISVEEGGEIWI
jgi:hypothetical protein